MLSNCSVSQTSLRASGSDSSSGPENRSFVHEPEAPSYPSNRDPTLKFRLRSTPHALRRFGSLLFAVQ